MRKQLLFPLLFMAFACQPSYDKEAIVKQLMDEALQERINNYKSIREERCWDGLIREANRMSLGIRAGDRLGDMLKQSNYMPPFARRMLTAGEESAELTKLCGVVARHYQRESAHLVKNAATVIEPVLIAVLTGVILVIALAIFLPMWDMVSLVG